MAKCDINENAYVMLISIFLQKSPEEAFFIYDHVNDWLRGDVSYKDSTIQESDLEFILRLKRSNVPTSEILDMYHLTEDALYSRLRRHKLKVQKLSNLNDVEIVAV